MRRVIVAAAVVLFAVSFAHAQDIVGDWEGTLHAGADLRLVLHITKGDGGVLKATLDSVDQAGANGIPVSSVIFKDSQLSLGVEIIHGSYEGKVSSDGNTISGTWSQGEQFPLEFKRSAAPVKPEHKLGKPSDIDGAWIGTLTLNADIKLRVVFHIVNTEDGLMAMLDSPDQGMKGLPVTKVTRDGATLKIEIEKISATFEGKIAPDLNSIDGIFTQGGPMPLVLHRLKDESELELRRPQNPTKPYPYHDEDVTYENKVQNVTLAATLTIPQGKGPFPAVVLITGSGPQDRDESLLGHKPFLVLSDYLTRHGIAVLRADDRGTAKSTGNFATATTADFATDTEAGIAYLKTRPEINPHKIGLIGHSEGGIIAPMIAARNPDVTFIVMMAGSGVPGDEILVAQVQAIAESSGKTHDEAVKAVAKEREILTLVKKEKDPAVLEKELKEKLADEGMEAQLGIEIKALTSPWFRYFMDYDPATALRKVTCPVLVLNGEKDKQVPPDQNLPPIRKALEEAGNKHFEIDELPSLNHLFQTAKTGSPSEYAQIEETIAPVALDKIASWILKQ